jgi:hypothetical protein
MLKGERDPYKLAELKDPRVHASLEEVARSLEGNWRPDLLFELQQAMEGYEFAQRQIRACDCQLQQYLKVLNTRSWQETAEAEPASAPAKKPVKRPVKPKGNAPAFDLKTELRRIAGVDLTTLEGIDVMTAQTILAEVGPDLSAFRDENHFASWLGLTPSKDISGGKVVGRGRRKVKNRVGQALRMAASTLRNSRSYLGARYRHLCHRFEVKAAAVKAMARYLAILVYRLLTYGQAWVDQGAVRFQQKQEQSELSRLVSRAAAHGLKLVPTSAELK